MTAYAAIEAGSTCCYWHQIVICSPAPGDCRAHAPAIIEVASPGSVWVGTAGTIAFDEPGDYDVRWSLFADAGMDTPWRIDEREVVVHVLGADHAAR